MKNYPKIGIRPIIDGRRGGIRESLEEMTMTMAESVAKLYSEKLRYADGTPVQCVIADRTIGGVAEAAMATEKFAANNVGAVLSVTPCWCYGSETIDMDPLMPKAIWGFNKSQRPGAVYLASALAGHNQKGLPAFGIYGRDVQDMNDNSITPDVEEKLLRFGRAAVAVMQMKGKSYLNIGSVSMGIAGSMPDPDFFQEYLG
ncbi:MAG: L-fucose isomerase, partial [Tidjanibacter sp.]|nr:L-fucose isomerase [Tidjanibacter sp.]